MDPPIQFDTLMGSKPVWRTAIAQALRGNAEAYTAEILRLRGFSPANAKVLECAYEYARCGQQVFCVGPRLQEMFNQTSIDKVPVEFLRAPYECSFLSLPKCSWELYGGPRTKMHRCGGMYLRQRSDRLMSLILWGMENKHSVSAGDDASFWIDVAMDEAPKTDLEDGTVVIDLEAYFKTILVVSNDASDPSLDFPKDHLKNTTRDLLPLFRVAINLILYLNSLKSEKDRDDSRRQRKRHRQANIDKKLRKIKDKTKRKKKRKKAEAELLKLSEAQIIWIGKTTEKAPRATEAQRKTAGTWQHRRGHWHSYWVGSRKIEGEHRLDPAGNRVYGDRKVLRWVAPVHRDMASVVASRGRHYRFREEKEDWKDGKE